MRRWLAACLIVAPAAACSPFGNGDTFACHTNGECNLNGELGTCTNIVEPAGGTCVYSSMQPGVDAPLHVDAPEPGSDVLDEVCVGVTLEVCLQPPPTSSRTLANIFDTGSAGTGNGSCDQIQKQTGGPDLCVLSGVDWNVDNLQVIGSRPLVVVATGALAADNVSASSGTAAGDGPDADDASCPVVAATNNSAGGAGGSFAGQGGAGGDGAGNNNGANASAPITVMTIRGGCPGQGGGSGGSAGHSGGAIYLLAAGDMSIAGTLLADGQGGGGAAGASGGMNGSGGGGGGTGGFIGLEAHSITASTATIFARAGAGGGGGGGVSNDTGDAGDNGDAGVTAGGNKVNGGDGGGGEGGDGGDANSNNGDNAKSGSLKGGGGGGGGGTGVIWVTGPFQGATTPSITDK